jgi:hypothetical protein
MMAVDFSPPFTWRSKYFSKTAAKQFRFKRATLVAHSSVGVRGERGRGKRERERERERGRERGGGGDEIMYA